LTKAGVTWKIDVQGVAVPEHEANEEATEISDETDEMEGH